MKFKILKVLALLVSISAASALIWNDIRDQKPKESRKDGVISQESMLRSTKSMVVGVRFVEIDQETSEYEVADEEVEKILMHSSKVSSAVLRAKDVEEIFESEKRDPQTKQEVPLQEE
jgi:hypothetical protein